MELELSLGDVPAPVKANTMPAPATCQGEDHDDLVLGLAVTATERSDQDTQRTSIEEGEETMEGEDNEACPLRQASTQTARANLRGFDVDVVVPVDGRASVARSLSPSFMHMDVFVTRGPYQDASEDEENGGGRVRKKLRLSKEQSAFLEDSFKEHNTLTLEQKSRLANRLSLRPRQVEVWFQNRRARTKLKQTEENCEHLKRRCEALARENRKLQREVAELHTFRAAYPLYCNHHLSGFSAVLPSACPSCVATARSSIAAGLSPGTAASPPSTLFPSRPHFGPFTVSHPVLRRQPSATS